MHSMRPMSKKNKNKNHNLNQIMNQASLNSRSFADVSRTHLSAQSAKKDDMQNNNSNSSIPIQINELLSTNLKKSYEEKRKQFIDFLSKVEKDMKENAFNLQNTIEDEDNHRLIVLQNIKNMIQEGDKMYASKKESTPFRTMILNFEDEENFNQIYRKKRICLDGQIRDDPFEYIEYLFQDNTNKEILNKILKNGSILQEFKWEKRESKLRDFYLKQIQNEYPEFSESIGFYHLRIFIPIHFLTIYASLKL